MKSLALVRGNAQFAETSDSPRPEIAFGIAGAIVFFVLFLGWAAFTPLDAAAHAHGQLVVSGERQTIQHPFGGVVQKIDVREGQHVSAGDVLIELAGADTRAEYNGLAAQLANLLAQRSRLEAELSNAPSISWAAELGDQGFPAELVQHAKAVQTDEFNARRSLLLAQQRVLQQESGQIRESARGYRSQGAAALTQERLLDDEIAGLNQLVGKGFVSANRIREMQRQRAETAGNREMYAAEAAQADVQASTTGFKQLEAERTFRERASEELRDVEMGLAAAFPKLRAARDQLTRLQVRAPVSGSVVGLTIFGPGTVVKPGDSLMDVVPDHRALLVRGRFQTDQAADLRPGQRVQVKLSSLHDRRIPDLSGKLARVSADSFVDSKTGASFYSADIQVDQGELRRLSRESGRDIDLRPGTPVEILVPLRKRTALDYLIEPLTRSLWGSLREQ